MANTAADAVDILATIFDLGQRRRRELKRECIIYLRDGEGADYCEISACDCADPSIHSDESAY